ncbi:MAG: GntR family transcriptional regulator [Lentisphaeria bacterium]|nr:GntR family transcriptional regulator [Lentisphaeria bacterium]
MISSKEKNSLSVIDKTFNVVLNDILQQKFKPGERLPGERELANIYGIGRSSMVKVLSKLQEERYIERVPVYGTFVRSDLAKRQQLFSIAFVTSDAVLSPENIDISSWSGIMEVMHGMFEEASAHPGVQITMVHAPDTEDDDILNQQFENISAFDGVIFCGCKMRELKKRYALTGKPALVILPKIRAFAEFFPCIDFNYAPAVENMANYISEISNSRKIILLHCKAAVAETTEILNIINGIFIQKDVLSESIYIDYVPTSESDIHAMLDSRFGSWEELKGTIIWCQNRKLLPVLNYLLKKNQINADLFGGPATIAAGNIYPNVTYLREPYFLIGHRAVSVIFNKLKNNIEITNSSIELSMYHGTKSLTTLEEL